MGVEVRMMRRLHFAGLILALFSCALLVGSAQAGAAKPQPNKVKLTAHPIWALAMDWPRVAYASGKEGNHESIHVWNVVTGATSVVNSRHGETQHASEIAIADKQLAWVKSVQSGNTELDHWLYTAPLGGSAHLLRRAVGYLNTGCGAVGPQIGGLVGSGNMLAVSTWTMNGDFLASGQRLNLITPTGLRTIATGADAIVSESADHGRIAALPPNTAKVIPDGCAPSTPPTSVAIYSTNGTRLNTIALSPTNPNDFGSSREIALSGKQLVVLTNEQSQSGLAKVTLAVYNWRTGALLHTWPVAVQWGDHLAVYGQLAAVEGHYGLHLLDLTTGKDVLIGHAAGFGIFTTIGPRGLVYAVNPHNTGKLVFVPMAKLLTTVS
jgi:hypothetical protein